MRVISGRFKGHTLKAVAGKQTRPTTDKVKETMFNIVGPYFSGGLGLDLFAGSGNLGIEAISRGLEKVIFVDKDWNAVQTIKRNLQSCKIDHQQSEVYRNDAKRALKALSKRNLQFQLILLDPPYSRRILIELLEFINENHMLDKNGTIICEHGHDGELPEQVGQLYQKKSSEFGSIGLTFFYQAYEDKGVQI